MTNARTSKPAARSTKTARTSTKAAPAKAAATKGFSRKAAAPAAKSARPARFSRKAEAAAPAPAPKATRASKSNDVYMTTLLAAAEGKQGYIGSGAERVTVGVQDGVVIHSDRQGFTDACVNNPAAAAAAFSLLLGEKVGYNTDDGIAFTLGSHTLFTLKGFDNKGVTVVVARLGDAETISGINKSWFGVVLSGADKGRSNSNQLNTAIMGVMGAQGYGYTVDNRNRSLYHTGAPVKADRSSAQAFIANLAAYEARAPKAQAEEPVKQPRSSRTSGKSNGNARSSTGNGRRWYGRRG